MVINPQETLFLQIFPRTCTPGKTFVGNCSLRISETAGIFPTEISSGKVNNIRRKCLVRPSEWERFLCP
ncbi:hypothetical protein MTR_6g032940 [Medicago truncatula]|uniref:Uncharacterized protein n=1 Tax=Medicago truncatula TaxID=3880 RepID=G7KQ63_MEDTR|nr:hypothetical protein MTR_6g032940 [Medicago truncatula]